MARTPKLTAAAKLATQKLTEARLEMQAIRATQNLRKLKESIALDWDFLGPWRELVNSRAGDAQWLPIGSQSARRNGTNFPFFQNEQQLAWIRDLSRIVVGTSNHAKGILRGLKSYTVGAGFQFSVSPKKGVDPDAAKGADTRITAFLDTWAKKVRWGERQQEAYGRTQRDGDGLIVLDPADGWLSLRFRWPEQLTQPPGGDFREWSFGIQTDPDDTETRWQYHFANVNDPTEIGELRDADDVVHLMDRETDSGIKRGLPLFSFDAKDCVDGASRLTRNLGEGAAVRAAIAFIRQHANATEEEVQAFIDSGADMKVKSPLRDAYQNLSKLEPGTVLDIPEGQEYAGVPADPGSEQGAAVCDLLIRSACAKVNAPEWLGTSNAANMGAFTSSLVAESPFVKGIIADQDYYKTRFMGIVERALALGAASGYIRREDLELVDVDLVAPSPETRNKLEESQRAAIEIPLGVQSRQGFSSEQGRDFDQIAADNRAWDNLHGGGTGQPLELPAGMGPGPKGSWPTKDESLLESEDLKGHEHKGKGPGGGEFTKKGGGGPGGGGTKVVGKDGSPLTVYHGTPHKFDSFDASRSGYKGGGALGPGVYFTTSPTTAEYSYGGGSKGGLSLASTARPKNLPAHIQWPPPGHETDNNPKRGNVIEAELDVRNPFQTNVHTANDLPASLREQAINLFGPDKKLSYNDLRKAGGDDASFVNAELEKHGYDGIQHRVIEDGEPQTHWLVFDTDRIRRKPSSDRERKGKVAQKDMSEKALRAQASATRVDASIQRYCEEHNEPKFAKAIGGLSFKDNEPVDVVVGKGGVIQHGIELKTMVTNKANKITMKRAAMERKAEWEKANKATFHTVVIDDSSTFNAKGEGKHDESKRRIFYRRGFGSFRVSTMHEVKNVAELKKLLNTPNESLPDAAKRKG